MTEDEKTFLAKRRGRNIALALTLAMLPILFYALTFVRMPK
jgi:hypothetical protein